MATDKLFDIMSDDGRYAFAFGPIEFRNINQLSTPRLSGKPDGLWYACGAEWLSWTLSEMPDWQHEWLYLYEVQITDAVLQLGTEDAVREFDKKYAASTSRDLFRGFMEQKDGIDWPRLARTHAGVEICPYQYELRFGFKLWYYGWDVASGCIWNERGVDSLRVVASRDSSEALWDVR